MTKNNIEQNPLVDSVELHKIEIPKPDDLNAKQENLNPQNINAEVLVASEKSNSRKITLTWENINVFLPKSTNNLLMKFYSKNGSKGEKEIMTPKPIINNVSGIARPFEILAIMGSSGSGKTTLLNVLNFRNRGSLKVYGDIKLNGKSINSPQVLSNVSGYVQQDDLFIGTLKVKEHLLFQAMLRMDKHTSKEERLKRIDEVLTDLNLKKCENSRIGIPERGIKGISGGQRRRLAFASEIITNPSILFCDEPTSGLDSFMAISIVECMKNLANNGKTIIFTIHQPSSELFEMFDKLCLITEGRLAFIGDRMEADEFFTSQGHKCPNSYNPSDHYIKTLSISPFDRENSINNINKICNGFMQSDVHLSVLNEINKISNSNDNLIKNISSEPEIFNRPSFKANLFVQIKWLFWRHMIDSLRDPLQLRILFSQTLVMAVVYGLIYLRLEMDQEGIQNMNGVLFICLLNCSFGTLFGVINTFPREIPLLVRENQNGIYKIFAYYVSKNLVDFPNHIIMPLIFTSIFYWMTNLNNDINKFFICGGIIALVAQTALAYGQFVSAVVPLNAASTDLAGPVTVPFMIFSGYFLNNNSIPKYFLWIKYLSWFGYANEALVVNQWSGVTNITCNRDESLCFLEGDEVIDYLNIDKENFSFNISMLVFLIVGWRILSFIVLMIRSYKR